MNSIKTYYKAFLWLLVITYLSFAPADDFDKIHITIPHFDKVVHFIMFFNLGVLISAINAHTKSKLHSISFPIIAIIYGAIIEIIQYRYIDTRSGDFIDWFADIAGLLIGIWIFNYLPKMIKKALIL